METFASYILDENKTLEEKMEIMCYLEKKLRQNPEKRIFFDKTVIFKTFLAQIFIETMNIDIDENLVLTAMLLCNCKKGSEPQKIGILRTYAKMGADYLATLGFNERFCKICEQLNRYSGSFPRTREGDLLEIIDQFGGMLLDRSDRRGYAPLDALIQLEHANLKDKDNQFKGIFREFVEKMEEINITNPENNMQINGLRALIRRVNK